MSNESSSPIFLCNVLQWCPKRIVADEPMYVMAQMQAWYDAGMCYCTSELLKTIGCGCSSVLHCDCDTAHCFNAVAF
jgi:hypothetical protein